MSKDNPGEPMDTDNPPVVQKPEEAEGGASSEAAATGVGSRADPADAAKDGKVSSESNGKKTATSESEANGASPRTRPVDNAPAEPMEVDIVDKKDTSVSDPGAAAIGNGLRTEPAGNPEEELLEEVKIMIHKAYSADDSVLYNPLHGLIEALDEEEGVDEIPLEREHELIGPRREDEDDDDWEEPEQRIQEPVAQEQVAQVPGVQAQAEQAPEVVEQAPVVPEAVVQVQYPVAQEVHPLAEFYKMTPEGELPEDPVARAVAGITLDEIRRGRNMTIPAITAPEDVRTTPRNETWTKPAATLKVIPREWDCLVMVVIRNEGASVIMCPAKREVCGDDRGDLYSMKANPFSSDMVTGLPLDVQGLYKGDVVIVRSVFRSQKKNPEDWSPVAPNLANLGNVFFVAKEFVVMERKLEVNMPTHPFDRFTSGKKGRKNQAIVYGIPRVAMWDAKALRQRPEGTVAADVFVPMVIPGQFVRSVKGTAEHRVLIRRTAKAGHSWRLPPTIFQLTDLDEETARSLQSAPMTFADGTDPAVAARAQAYAATFGVYGSIAVDSRNEDLRHFAAQVVRTESDVNRGRYVFLEVLIGSQTTSSNKWPKGASIAVSIGDGDGFHSALINARIRGDLMMLKVRMTSQVPLPPIGTDCVIRQDPEDKEQQARQAPRLRDIPEVNAANHAMRALAALSGAGPLPPLPLPDLTDLVIQRFTLPTHQAGIVRTLASDEFTALAIDCGFGTGKTTTLAFSAIHRASKKSDTSIMVGVSNSAVVAAVNKVQQVDESGQCKMVRLVSDKNLNKLAPEHKTAYDFPDLWLPTLTTRVRQFDRSHEELTTEIIDMAKYCLSLKSIRSASLNRRDLKAAARGGRPVHNIVYLFFRVYRPNLVVGTVSSVISFYQREGMAQFANHIGLMLLDEASQTPRYAFMSLCHVFPRSRPVLFGDIRQLPPYSNVELPKRLREMAIGRVLEEATVNNLFPQMPLMHVRRCPTEITQILGGLFYGNHLQSGRNPAGSYPDLRALRLPSTHPLILMSHRHEQTREGPSVSNEEEIRWAMSIVERLHEQSQRSTFAMLAFYKAAVNFATSIAPEYLHVNTVDGAQGLEFDYVIVLTSKTTRGGAFINDANRINVAISRTKTACLVFGKLSFLKGLSNWNNLISMLPPSQIYHRQN